jgi:alkylhydroperoxidase family enzyme
VINHRPAYAAAYREVEAALWEQDVVGRDILELCQQRIGHLLGTATWDRRAMTSEEQTALDYAEQLLLDAQGVTDEQAAEVIKAFGEDGFLVLTYACGFFETTQRAQLLLAPRAGR